MNFSKCLRYTAFICTVSAAVSAAVFAVRCSRERARWRDTYAKPWAGVEHTPKYASVTVRAEPGGEEHPFTGVEDGVAPIQPE